MASWTKDRYYQFTPVNTQSTIYAKQQELIRVFDG